MNRNEEPQVQEPEPTTEPRRPRDERGASLVEYVLLVALIAVVLVGAAKGLGSSIDSSFDDSNNKITAAIAG